MESHCEIGDLYVEFRKGMCSKNAEQCDFCLKYPPLRGRVLPVPRPFPDYEQLPKFKYKSYENTPLFDGETIEPRDVDDFNPRVHLKNLFDKKELNSSDATGVKNFSIKFIVDEDLVLKRLRHLEYLKLKKDKRAELTRERRKREKRRPVENYDWVELYRSGNLSKLPGHILDKYLTHHSLRKPRLISEKRKTVKKHIEQMYLRRHVEDNLQAEVFAHDVADGRADESFEEISEADSTNEDDEPSSSNEESESEDLVLNTCDSSPESGSESEAEDSCIQDGSSVPIHALGQTRTRQGRSVRPPSHLLDYY